MRIENWLKICKDLSVKGQTVNPFPNTPFPDHPKFKEAAEDN